MNPLDLTGTTAIVTGASGGIGAGIAARLAEVGAHVVVHYNTAEHAAQALAEQITGQGGRARTARAELTDDDACRALVASALDWTGRLDVLVNNAAIQPVKALPELTPEDWQAMLATDLTAAHSTTRHAATAMSATAGAGSIIQIASIEALQPAPGHAHYAAAKSALLTYTRSAAFEYGAAGIRVNAVSPGLIHRPGIAEAWPEGVARWEAAAPLRRLGTPRDVADAVLFLASPLSGWITGHNLVVDGGVGTRPTW